jgi:hypothetical protein
LRLSIHIVILWLRRIPKIRVNVLLRVNTLSLLMIFNILSRLVLSLLINSRLC